MKAPWHRSPGRRRTHPTFFCSVPSAVLRTYCRLPVTDPCRAGQCGSACGVPSPAPRWRHRRDGATTFIGLNFYCPCVTVEDVWPCMFSSPFPPTTEGSGCDGPTRSGMLLHVLHVLHQVAGKRTPCGDPMPTTNLATSVSPRTSLTRPHENGLARASKGEAHSATSLLR